MSVCQHCNKRNATFAGHSPACMFCVNTGHKSNLPVKNCPKCSVKPKPPGGEPMTNFENFEFKKAA